MEIKAGNFGLIGEKLSHSFSKKYFEQKFDALKLDSSYTNIELDEIEKASTILEKKFNGFNVTIPYKEAIIPFLDELTEEAKAVGAVNTIQFKEGKKIGHNTDVYGFKQMIKPFFKSHHERAIIIGTGGASKAVAYVLENLGVNLIYISRTPQKENHFSYEEINDLMIKHNGIVVNTTPVGMYPNDKEIINLPYHCFSEKHLVIDLIYNPEETLFLKKAKENGAWTLNGLTMLHQQAEEAWRIWND